MEVPADRFDLNPLPGRRNSLRRGHPDHDQLAVRRLPVNQGLRANILDNVDNCRNGGGFVGQFQIFWPDTQDESIPDRCLFAESR